jgi:nucleoside-diphosphate-sugar epimerase
MNAQRALVTGATGFIGRHLVDGLIDARTPVVALIRPGSQVPDQWRGRVTCVVCADWSELGLRAALASQSFDVAFHLATYGVHPSDRDPDLMVRINVDLPALLVRFCRERGARVVLAGTFSEYQRPAGRALLTEQSPLETGKIYGASKAAGGILAHALAESLGVKLRLLRFFKVYGEGEAPHRLLPSLVAGLARGERVPLSDGTQVRDFIHVDDIVDACIKAGDDTASPSRPLTATWNVCTGVGHSVRTFAALVAQAMNDGNTSAGKLGERSKLLGFGELPMRADDEPYLVGDGGRMYGELGWRPQHDLAAGIRAAAAALMANQRAAV